MDMELKRLLKGLAELQSCPDINITEVFYPSDERAKSPQCCEAIVKEVKGLLERGVSKRVKKKEVPPGSTILTTRMVLAVKDIGTKNEKYKARLAAHGHKDRDKNNCVLFHYECY